VDALDELVSRPMPALIDDLAALDGDLLFLGVAGKVGPLMARMARRAAPDKRVIGVARFSDPSVREQLEAWGVETIPCDLIDPVAVSGLPRVRNVIFMAGRKFGTTGDEAFTWLMNAYVPGLVGAHFQGSRMVAFSTLCVYPFAPVDGPGCDESCPPAPPGEYGNSCVGRERLIQHFTRAHGTSGRLARLNYAIDLRYGVLCDIGQRILAGDPIDLTTGHVSVIWQGDASVQILRCLRHTTSPATPINIGAPAHVRVRDLAEGLGARLGRTPRFAGTEAPDAWVNDTRLAQRLFGLPDVPLERMLDWTADWLRRGMPCYDKPTRYELRNGAF
jgi:nucleoside-diphosphate-sugar epimerase